MNEDIEISLYDENEYIEINSSTTDDVEIKGTDIIYVNSTDYEKIKNKPQINDIELIGNKNFKELGMEALSNLEIESLLK